MKRYSIGIVLVIFSILAGCAATGTKYEEMDTSLPSIESGMGRIYFYRPGKVWGGAIRPKVWLNGQVIGKSTPGGFFYVDSKPGDYQVSLTSEVEKSLTFTLDEGQTRYVRLSVGMGVAVYRVYPELKDQSEALPELRTLSYIGANP
jgi:hypothetical protein